MATSSDEPELTHQRLAVTIQGGEELFIEKIMDKSVAKSVVEYLIKWEGSSDDEEYSWEREENLNYIEGFKTLAKEFNQKRFEEEARRRLQTDEPLCEEVVGFERGLPPQEIIGKRHASGQIWYLVRWQAEGTDLADFVTAKEALEHCPELVVKYCEEGQCEILD